MGMQMLHSMLTNGLLLTPEVLTVNSVSFTQQRICFTELAPDELPEHAENFGNFALEFSIASLRELGAMPVFYVPNHNGNLSGFNGVGMLVPSLIVELKILLTRLKDLKSSSSQNFSLLVDNLAKNLHPIEQLFFLPDVLLNLCYPTENLEYTSSLGYYRQREWRIISNFVNQGEWPMKTPTDEQKEELLKISPFFSRDLPIDCHLDRRKVSHCMYFSMLGDKSVMSCLQKILVPAQVLERAKAMVTRTGLSIPVQSLK